jgi:DNA invertase Pin-like site-specific DNA recombinase
MQNRVIIYTVSQSCSEGTSPHPLDHLRQTVEDRGDFVVASFVDYGPEVRLRQRNVGWRSVLASLNGVDQVAIMSAADLPGKSVPDLLKLLDHLRQNAVSLFMVKEGIDTSRAGIGFVVLDIIRAYRSAKLSRAIKIGQARALTAGKVIGRPVIPPGVLARIRVSLAQGDGVRPTARRWGVSPGTVINIRRTMTGTRAADVENEQRLPGISAS